VKCPACAADLPEEDLFCESCGMSLRSGPVAPKTTAECVCGAAAGENDEEGFCLRCGRRVVRPASDHIEESLSPRFAAVSDRGLKHDRNEDRFSIFRAGAWHGMAVCDGVSASWRSEVASQAVSQGIAASLANDASVYQESASEVTFDPEEAMRRAISAGAANLAAEVRLPQTNQNGILNSKGEGESPSSTTVVAALVTRTEMVFGWVGDSRAYWIDAGGAALLTRDHSWLNDATAAGGMTMQQAMASPQAHAITRWIGADAGPDSVPEIVRRAIPGPGMVLLCTDGLWNYLQADTVDGAVELAKLVAEAGEDALVIARELVRFANGRGGQDNITVAVLRAG
jgi:serine/threonine protein phosphatase PrpC